MIPRNLFLERRGQYTGIILILNCCLCIRDFDFHCAHICHLHFLSSFIFSVHLVLRIEFIVVDIISAAAYISVSFLPAP